MGESVEYISKMTEMYHNKQNNVTHVPSSKCVSSISHATATNKTKQIKYPIRSALIYFFDLLFFYKIGIHK